MKVSWCYDGEGWWRGQENIICCIVKMGVEKIELVLMTYNRHGLVLLPTLYNL